MACATEKQIALLAKLKIPAIPTTRVACSRLIGYILNGNYTVGDTVGERVQIVHDYWSRWCGVRIRHKEHGREGVVVMPFARSKQDVQRINAHIKDARKLSPFVLQVKWDSGAVATTTIPFVERLS